MSASRGPSDRRVTVNCYTFFDKVFPTLGMLDYTEGLYGADGEQVTFEEAQQRQIRYVLDEVQCATGTRLLDVGCGNGTLVEEAQRRGARAVGITISPEQVALCRRRGLDVHELDYRDLPQEWSGQFDAVVANGPIEHFVHPRDAIAGRDDAIYREMFDIFHRMIDPRSSNRRLINTTIHFMRRPDPQDLLRSPWSLPRGSEAFHYAMLERSFGGFYPTLGQLERNATGRFRLIKTVDGTRDYARTSEEWLRRCRRAMFSLTTGPRVWWRSVPMLLRHPRQSIDMLLSMLVTQSWNWQFRGSDPPTRLLRQTWAYV